MKNIFTLSLSDAEEILENVFPGKTPLSNKSTYEYWVEGLSFDKVLDSDGSEFITMSGQSIIGILYRGGLNNDGFLLSFSNMKVICWLYEHGYDIGKFLTENKDLTEYVTNFHNMANEVFLLSGGEENFADGYKHNWTLDYVKKKCTEIYNKYYLSLCTMD